MDSQSPRDTELKPSISPQRDTNHTKVEALNKSENNKRRKRDERENNKRIDHVHGHVYQLKLLMLFLYRGVQLRYFFRLGTEVKAAQKFDDIVFECTNEDGRKEYLLLQAKHKLDDQDKISAMQLLTESDGPFSLIKYFFSYRNVKEAEFFKGSSIKNVIVCTNIDFDSGSLDEAGINVQEINDKIDILTVKDAQKQGSQYKFKQDLCSKLKPILLDYDLKELAKNLCTHILKNSCMRHNQENIFKIYHEALAEEVIDVKCKKFRENFVKNKNISDSARKFRTAFVKEIDEQSKNQLTLDNINEAIMKQKIVINNTKIGLNVSKKYGIGTSKNWPSNSISDDEVKEYLNCLVFAVDQPNEQELEKILIAELGKEFDVIATKNTYNKLFVEMMAFLQGKGDSKFQSYKDGKEFFEEAKRGLPLRFNLRAPVSLFTGRVEKLEELHEALQSGGTAILQAATMSGLGGVGKSELARKYVSEYSQDYDDKIVWINAESFQSLVDSFRRLAKDKLRISLENYDGQEKEIKSIVEDVYRFFSKGKSLFIFDNAEKRRSTADRDEGIDQFLPPLISHTDRIYILITSRNQNWGNMKSLLLDTFTEKEAVEFIKKALKIENDEQENDIVELAKKLQYFPLTLHQVVAYIKITNEELKPSGEKFEIRDYLNLREEETEESIKFPFPDDSDNSYIETTFTMWEITMKKIKQKECGQEACTIFDVLAYFVPEGIIATTLMSLVEHDERKLGRAVQLLKQYSMVTLGQEQTVINIHRLVQQVTRIKIRDEKREKECLRKALQLFENNVNSDNVDLAVSVWEYATEHNELVEEFCCLPAQVIEQLSHMLRYREAHSYGEKALRILQNELGSDHYQCSVTMSNKALVLFHQGRYDDALKDFREVKRIHGDKIFVDDNIGLILKNQGAHKMALETFQSIVESNRSLEDVTRAKHNMALVYIEQERYDKALEMLDVVLDAGIYKSNPNHEYICNIIYSMGVVLEKQGHYGQALMFFEDTQTEMMKSSMPNNRTIALAIRFSIAKMQCYRGQGELCHKMFNEILQEREKLMPDHPCILETKCMMVLSLLRLEKNVDALDFLRQIVSEFKQIQRTPVPLKTQSVVNFMPRTQLSHSGFDVTILDQILCCAASQGSCEIIDVMSNSGADINARNTLFYSSETMMPADLLARPLRTKAKKYWNIINTMPRTYANNNFGAPLHFAANNNKMEALHNLLKARADVNNQTDDGWTPLSVAVARRHAEIVNALLDNNATIDLTNSHGLTPLHIAGKAGDIKIVNALLENGANVNFTNSMGKTPLYVAASDGLLEVVGALLNYGANVNATIQDGRTPLHEAARKGHSEVVQILLKYDADVDAATTDNAETALHYAAYAGHLEVVHNLLRHGATFNAVTSDRLTPLDFAVRENHREIAKTLWNAASISILYAIDGLTQHGDLFTQ